MKRLFALLLCVLLPSVALASENSYRLSMTVALSVTLDPERT